MLFLFRDTGFKSRVVVALISSCNGKKVGQSRREDDELWTCGL